MTSAAPCNDPSASGSNLPLQRLVYVELENVLDLYFVAHEIVLGFYFVSYEIVLDFYILFKIQVLLVVILDTLMVYNNISYYFV